MIKLYTPEDMVLLNQFAAGVMPTTGPHDVPAVLAERSERAFVTAQIMLAQSKRIAELELEISPAEKPPVKRTKKVQA